MTKPLPTVTQNSWAFLRDAMVTPTGFREYDARWKFPDEINLPGITALGLGLGTQMFEAGIEPVIAVANDYRDYSLSVKNALILGLMQAGVHVKDIGPAVSPMAYFAQFHLDTPAVAMVTASHNPNGWTGVKMGFQRPLTHGPDEMGRLRDIVLSGEGVARPGGGYEFVDGVREAYLDDLAGDFKMTRKLRVVCATGNGTASAFAPELFERIGVEVVPSHNRLDYSFPHYNPNPEAMEMLHDMAASVKDSGADFALGFDGDGDRCGVVDNEGEEIFADKMGVIMARDLAKIHPGATFVADVKSTGLFASDPELKKHGAKADYWKTGHSHMKRRVHELGALAGFEKSGHYFLAGPIGRGYDCGMRVAVEICKLMDRNPDMSMADLRGALPVTYATPTMSPYCADTEKYEVLERLVDKLVARHAEGGSLGGVKIADVVTVNGARVMLENGGWGLVRASSNTPNLVVVCESPESEAQMRAIFEDIDAVIRTEPAVGDYDQTI
ncbi:phosphomannomutase/phosphoglucomutase [Roseobacter sp. HKCCD9010]|uniref:phosphomannomutase/phosphoglucomutase n=1 Tax=unclassified Roseobacter TaxID=196798 RepID=UPI0014917BF3|nr:MULTISPECIES: phosphomannomutase/phosphoglucomutase [unclassified Roseobacter]MBF9051613.1 phosphomannomutase/phosphoglucomutase [Rhodobacterales bacterium HKCCD4356]NNV13137.1 phosphomannomutase/phosphoglucomutase [Roseobacter sp. HKCCD7357]NNV17388.1 phosphomannomutase/phosphoglucomutase [Roseobacter sp. HKCCD8768]NNV26994.1 phosphomannomutase/phosphoglucomutase [Roseobacter sp. HKCCD8192]NNV31114.1 phosphomannomutase/phosphoglucomutase [Roseobacter sp. HKCCD9061]